MKRHLVFVVTLSAAAGCCGLASGSGWVFRPSYYSHDPASAERVVQYEAPRKALAPNDPTYAQSGYRQHRASVQVGGSYDHLHIVETWGAGESIRPYGEWEFPYRAGATPYGPWGNPSGPWTTPFGSWDNPYGLGKLPYPPWPYPGPGPYPGPYSSPPAGF